MERSDDLPFRNDGRQQSRSYGQFRTNSQCNDTVQYFKRARRGGQATEFGGMCGAGAGRSAGFNLPQESGKFPRVMA